MNTQIKSWKNLRDQADKLVGNTLKTHFPCEYGRPRPGTVPKSNQKEELIVGRALWAYARSDLTIKTMQLKLENTKNQS